MRVHLSSYDLQKLLSEKFGEGSFSLSITEDNRGVNERLGLNPHTVRLDPPDRTRTINFMITSDPFGGSVVIPDQTIK